MFNSINTLPGLLDDVQDSCTQALDSLPCPPRRGRKVTTPLASLLLSKVRQKLVLFGSAASHTPAGQVQVERLKYLSALVPDQ
jgi:hypothetical protein